MLRRLPFEAEEHMGLIPLGDASRRPVDMPRITIGIVLVNAVVFALEIIGGEAFVTKWSVIPAEIASGRGGAGPGAGRS